MTEARMRMIDNVIRKYGFERPATILFCRQCEERPNTVKDNDAIREMYKHLMSA